jgi:glutamate racemase
MVGPTVASLRGITGNILLVATTATVRSGIYQNAFRMIGKDIDALPVPLLAGALECGAPHDECVAIIREALYATPKDAYQVLILGCTHYPFAIAAFKEVLGHEMHIVDPAVAVAERALKRWWPREVGDGSARFLISADTPAFRAKVETLFPMFRDAIEVVE